MHSGSRMLIVMIRHTHVGVPKGTCYGWSDVPVADTFEEEAAETKRDLEATLSSIESSKYTTGFDAVFSSPLTRARKLAAYCGYSNPMLDERLKEMNMGDWEMQKYDDIKDDALQMWYQDYMHLKATNGEGFPDLYARVASFFDDLLNNPEKITGNISSSQKLDNVAIFAHGGVLIAAGIYFGLFPAEDCFSQLVPCGGIQVIDTAQFVEK